MPTFSICFLFFLIFSDFLQNRSDRGGEGRGGDQKSSFAIKPKRTLEYKDKMCTQYQCHFKEEPFVCYKSDRFTPEIVYMLVYAVHCKCTKTKKLLFKRTYLVWQINSLLHPYTRSRFTIYIHYPCDLYTLKI